MLPLLADIAISTESVALFASILLPVASAIVYLWRIDLHRIDTRDAAVRAERDRLLDIVLEHGLGSCIRTSRPKPDPPKTPGE